MSSKSGQPRTSTVSKTGRNASSSQKSSSGKKQREAPAEEEEDIFMDKEELLREKLDKMNAQIVATCDQLKSLQCYNNWLDLALEEKALQNHELSNYVQKKQIQKANHSVTLSDFHCHNIEVLKQEREEMLQEFSKKEEALREELSDEQKVLDRCREELSRMDELKSIKLKQEQEIDQLEKHARMLRTNFSQQINQLKEKLQIREQRLEREGKQQLKQIGTDAQRQSVQLVIEKIEDLQQDNRNLRDDIWRTRHNIQVLENNLNRLIVRYKELRREKIHALDLDFVHNRRLEGLLELCQ